MHFEMSTGKWASLLAGAVHLGWKSSGETHTPVLHAQTTCGGVEALLLADNESLPEVITEQLV
jgi:hypothetical protein